MCFSAATPCNTLQHPATNCNTLPAHSICRRPLSRSLSHCFMLFCYNTLQHTATHCVTLQHTATHCNTLQHPATHCSTLQHPVISCSTLPAQFRTRRPLSHKLSRASWLFCGGGNLYTIVYSCVCVCVHISILYIDLTYCNTLQHTATHCNTLQHTQQHLQHLAAHRRFKYGGVASLGSGSLLILFCKVS